MAFTTKQVLLSSTMGPFGKCEEDAGQCAKTVQMSPQLTFLFFHDEVTEYSDFASWMCDAFSMTEPMSHCSFPSSTVIHEVMQCSQQLRTMQPSNLSLLPHMKDLLNTTIFYTLNEKLYSAVPKYPEYPLHIAHDRCDEILQTE